MSDYLYILDPKALRRLLAWQDLTQEDAEYLGSLKVRLVQWQFLPSKPQSFHPKAWRVVDQLGALIAIGSSNLSRPALQTGVEWNLLYSSHDHSAISTDFGREFEELWLSSVDLSADVVERYEAATLEYRRTHYELEAEDQPYIPEPRPWQRWALQSLREIRDSGCARALVAVANLTQRAIIRFRMPMNFSR